MSFPNKFETDKNEKKNIDFLLLFFSNYYCTKCVNQIGKTNIQSHMIELFA